MTREEAEQAARLFGAAEALREAVGYQHSPEEDALREPYLAAASSRLEETWEAALAEGRAMELEEAIQYALLGEEPSATLPPPPRDIRRPPLRPSIRPGLLLGRSRC